MQLALGTVQFGLAYGVAGRGHAVPAAEARRILQAAHARGVRWLDTATAYGDIESRLAGLADGLDFAVVIKLPACPAGLSGREAAAWADTQLARTQRHLGPALQALLFHRAEDLLEPQGDALWAAASAFAHTHGLRLGVSCYDVATLHAVHARYPVALAQLPGNALDQQLRLRPPPAGIEIHLRSAFLQGLLLMPETEAARRVPAAAAALARWHVWRSEQELTALGAALAVVKGFEAVQTCVVGVDTLAQFEAIADAWAAAPALQAPQLHVADADVTDPRRWPAGA